MRLFEDEALLFDEGNDNENKKELIPTTVWKLKSSNFSCHRHRNFEDIEIIGAKIEAYDNAIGMRDIFQQVLWDKTATIDDIDDMAAQMTGFDESLADNDSDDFDAYNLTLKKKTLKKANHYKRYCFSEKARGRKNLIDMAPSMNIVIGNIYCIENVRPQALFLNHSSTNMPILEAVWYNDKKAGAGLSDRSTLLSEIEKYEKKYPEAGRIDEGRLKKCPLYLRQYVLLKYTQLLLADENFCYSIGLTKDQVVTGMGSEYFMEMKSADSETTNFFEGNSNIFYLNENYTVGRPNEGNTELDDIFADYAKLFLLGKEPETCSKTDCEYCDLNASCGFKKSPVKMQEKETDNSKKKKEKIEPTDAQKKMLSVRKGNNLTIARAGSGKTAMLIELVSNLLQEGTKLSEIFLTTFTKNAAAELKKRLESKIPDGEDINDAHIMTFHAFAMEIIGENYEWFGYTEKPKEIDTVSNSRIINELVTSHKISGPNTLYEMSNFVIRIVSIAIQLFAKIGENPEGLDSSNPSGYYLELLSSNTKEHVTTATINELIDIYEEYKNLLKEDNVILFSDMEHLMHEFLIAHPNYLDERYGFKVILLDEWQDSNDIQMKTVKLLNATKSKELLLAVGDDGQSIYAFRNANVDNILNFEEKLGEKVEIINMLENWRSTPEILSLADDFLENNENRTEGRAVAGRPNSFVYPEVKGYSKEENQYNEIVEKIKKYHNEDHYDWSQMMFCSQTRKELTKMAGYLAKEGIPYVIKCPIPFFENSRVQAALAFIENAYYQPETTSGFFAYLAAKYDGEMLNTMDPEDITAEITNLQETYKNIDEVDENLQRIMLNQYLDVLRKDDEVYESFLDDYLYKYLTIEDEIEFINDFNRFGKNNQFGKRMDQDYEGVALVTMHSSKGLEWDICFVSISEADNVLLHSKNRTEELEEKRRLIYVAMTRAKDILHVSGLYVVPGTKSRKDIMGKPDPVYNQFLKELFDIKGILFNPNSAEKGNVTESDIEKEMKEQVQRRRTRTTRTRTKKKIGEKICTQN